jgi:RNA polymerase sigma factor (sigma-70 family)
MPESKKYSEDELVVLLKQRQRSAFDYLYDNYSAALYSVVLSILANTELSQDTLQEVFIKIWRQIEQYDAAKARLFTWMVNIARNASIDTIRSKGYRQSKENREVTEAVYEYAGFSAVNVDNIGLRKIVQKLKPEHKVLVELSYFQGFTQDEISKMLEIPLGTVKTRMRGALIQLRELIK